LHGLLCCLCIDNALFLYWVADLFVAADAWTTENYMPVQVVYELVKDE
jgi:hypothetical protein